MMLSISSTLHDIQQAHQQGMNMKQIARQLSVGENKLRRILTAAGFEYDASLKHWRYVRMDDGAILQRSFWSLDEYGVGTPDTTGKVRKSNVTDVANVGKTEKAAKSNATDADNVMQGNATNIATFTQDEILILKQMAARQAAAPATDDSSSDILDALKAAPKGKTAQKTFVINKAIIDELDAFCDHHRIKKSDFLAIAIQDALNKFNN